MKLLAAAFWASWFALQWLRVFGIGDQALLNKQQWSYLVTAILLTVLYFLDVNWQRHEEKERLAKRTRLPKPMPPRKND